MSGIDHLLRVIDAYASGFQGMEDSKVSWRVFKDSKKVRALRGGKDIQVTRLESAFRWLSDNWPGGVDWPADVPRPAPAEEAA